MTRALVVALVLLASPATARADDVSAGQMTHLAEGTIGPYRVGFNVTEQDHATVTAAHYYYASTGTDIPLRVSGPGDALSMDEPGGGHFELHLTNADAKEPRPLTFYTATGLAGTWTRNGRTLPVTLGFSAGYDGTGPARWYADVTDEAPAAFEARVRNFLKGILSGNRAQAAAAVSYPLTVNGAPRQVIRTRAQFLSRWPSLFTPAALASLRTAIPHEMFVRDGMAMVASGAVWFDARGAKVLNLP